MPEKERPPAPKRSERGQSLTELAISFTMLVLLLAVAVDVGRMFFSFIAIREAAEEGVIYGSFSPDDEPGIIARARGSSSDPIDLSDTSLVSVTVENLGPECAGNSVRVTVTYTFQLTMPLLGPILGTQSFPLSAAATGTVLYPTCP